MSVYKILNRFSIHGRTAYSNFLFSFVGLAMMGDILFVHLFVLLNSPLLLFGTIRYVDWVLADHSNSMVYNFIGFLGCRGRRISPINEYFGNFRPQVASIADMGEGSLDLFPRGEAKQAYCTSPCNSSSDEFLALPNSLRLRVSKGYYRPADTSLFWDKTYDVYQPTCSERVLKGSFRDPKLPSSLGAVNSDSQIFTPAARRTMAGELRSGAGLDLRYKCRVFNSDPTLGHKLCFTRDPSGREGGPSFSPNFCDKGTQTSLPFVTEAGTQTFNSLLDLAPRGRFRMEEDSP